MALIYSTDKGKTCPSCHKAIAECRCVKEKVFDKSDTVYISRETKGRKGKGVTLIKGIGGSEQELKTLAKFLKQKCNCGGSVKDGVIEIQGDHRELIKKLLIEKDYKVKLSGG